MELLKLLSANELVAQLICFLLLFIILRVLLWKRILAVLDARKEKIASDFKTIEDMKTDLSRTKNEYAGKISKIEEEARMKIGAAISEGKRQADEIRLKAETDGEKLIQNAKASIHDEVVKAKEELKDGVVDLAIKAAEQVIAERLSEEGDRKIVEDYLKGIDKS